MLQKTKDISKNIYEQLALCLGRLFKDHPYKYLMKKTHQNMAFAGVSCIHLAYMLANYASVSVTPYSNILLPLSPGAYFI